LTGRPSGSEVLALARELIGIETVNPPGAEAAAADHVAAFLRDSDVQVEVQRFGAGRANLVARVPGSGRERGLLLSGHLDTVPVGDGVWTTPPLEGVVRDGHLFGRGAVDMKGAVAAMTVALRDLSRNGRQPHGDVVLALSAGEELDGCGAELLTSSGVLGDVGMAVVGEPSGLEVGIAHRGALWVRAEAAGEPGHGSQPRDGANAVRALLEWLSPFDEIEMLAHHGRDPILGPGTVSLNVIGGGHTANVVPDSAFAVLDFRSIPGQDHGALLKALRARAAGVRLTVLRDAAPVRTSADARVVDAAVEAVTSVTRRAAATRGLPYVTDASTFVKALDIPVVVLGPGRETEAHTDDESIEVSSLDQAAAIYERIAERLMYDEARRP
jgi:succinyl-diaminopimelate desuccinylase